MAGVKAGAGEEEVVESVAMVAAGLLVK
jgi:hypothetical protein